MRLTPKRDTRRKEKVNRERKKTEKESHKTIARAKRNKPATENSIASGDSQCSSELF